MNRANLKCLFGSIPEDAPNLEIVGAINHEIQELKWPSIWGESGLVLSRNGLPLIDSIWHPDLLQRCPKYRLSKQRFIPHIKFGTYFNTMLFWCRGYYHWICDVLPRVLRALPHLPPETKFIVPAKMGAPFMEALEAVGVPASRCEAFEGKRPWRVQRLIHVPPVAMTGDHTPESLVRLRKSVFRYIGSDPVSNDRRKIYISRRPGLERVLTNEKEVVKLLAEMGIEQVFCEDLSFAEQVKLFQQANFVIGPHGAGFTNTIWCNSGTKVFEIFHPQSVRRCYWSIAQSLDLHHSCGVAVKVTSQVDRHGMRIDIDELRDAIQSIIK